SRFGTFSGTLRSPSMSSENAIRRVLILSSVSTRKAWRTMVVRATSPKGPMCGRPEGPEPVSNTTPSLGCFFRRGAVFGASWNGQAFEFSAISRRAGTWASTVDINGSPAADTKNHTRWRQSKHLRCNHSAKEDALEATGSPEVTEGQLAMT